MENSNGQQPHTEFEWIQQAQKFKDSVYGKQLNIKYSWGYIWRAAVKFGKIGFVIKLNKRLVTLNWKIIEAEIFAAIR